MHHLARERTADLYEMHGMEGLVDLASPRATQAVDDTIWMHGLFTAPAPALAALAAGSEVLDAGGVGAFDDDRVDNIWLFATGGHPRAIMVSLSDEAAGPNEIELAGEIALDAARTAVWRSLREEEDLAVVRQVHD